MLRFNCDYSEGADARILEKLVSTNLVQTEGYGEDCYCKQAKELIKAACQRQDADVHFLVGGTQTNLTVIASALRPYQGVLCADTVQPKMVYISQPTELGTLYSREELAEISDVCHRNGLLLYVDGARLGYGLAAKDNTVSLPDLAEFCDVFYIGGTKIGALFGEAVVIVNPCLKEGFRYIIKQKGGMLAKGRLLGIQFLGLFENDLYMELCGHADRMADLMREAFRKAGYPFLVENTTNQLFPILSDSELERLREKYEFAYQQRVDAEHSAVRFCTSWATKEGDVESLIQYIL